MPLHGKRRWASTFRQQQMPLVLVGHSLGGSVILRYLADHGIPAGLAGVVADRRALLGNVGLGGRNGLCPTVSRRALPGCRASRFTTAATTTSRRCRMSTAMPRPCRRRWCARSTAAAICSADGNVADIVADIAAAFAARSG